MEQERSFSELMQDIVHNLQDLVRSEVRLAKAEVREETEKVKTAGAFMAAGGMLGLFGFFFLLLSAFRGLSLYMPDWEAALIVAGALIVISGLLTVFGAKLLKKVRTPPVGTLKNIRETVRWAKAGMK